MFIVTQNHCEVLQLDRSAIRLRIAVPYWEPWAAASKVSVLVSTVTRLCLIQALHKWYIDPMSAMKV
jgi:hypothetical protein